MKDFDNCNFNVREIFNFEELKKLKGEKKRFYRDVHVHM